jgi:cell division protein FtsB
MNPLLAATSDSTVSWDIGYAIAVIVVLVVVALVVPILLLAHRIGNQAGAINDALTDAVDNTAALAELRTTNASATAIVAGLERGRTRLGG